MPGSGYVLLHHVMGETDGDRNVWSWNGAVSLAINRAAKEVGVHLETNAEVSELMIEDSGRVNGVLLADGRQAHSSFVLSNATPSKTFRGTTKINVAVDKLPQFQCLKMHHQEVGPHHTATIRIGCESMEKIESACQDAWNGYASQRPIMEMTIPSSLDKTVSPPGFSSSIIGYDMLTPPDLEREFGLTGGNIFHGAMSLDALFLTRPVKQWSGYRTPMKGLYMCGSGSHPGGGVTDAPCHNAAQVVLCDIKESFFLATL
ncbi:hypothetical protein JCGZ_25645 [Jatropha curcas]|uniref:Amine oxidase domain-containing protein n=1 Tax=Jatropha curcas TaxID=180498 RepID=A0A067JXT0_JATCU|nr:hypothetical protein JCGZ_25645 [Jatropha curcas]